MAEELSLRKRLEAQRKELATKGSGGKFFSVKEGTSRFRPLPVGDEREFAIEATYFFLEGDIKGVISPATFGKKCHIMAAYTELSGSKDETDREMAKKFKPNKKYFMPVIKYKDEKGKEVDAEAGVKLLILTSGQYQELLDYWLDEDEAGDFTDVKNGYDIKFGRTGKGKMDTEYTTLNCKPSPTPKPYGKKVYDPEAMLKEIAATTDETKTFIEKYLKVSAESGDDDKGERKNRRSRDKDKTSKKKKRDI